MREDKNLFTRQGEKTVVIRDGQMMYQYLMKQKSGWSSLNKEESFWKVFLNVDLIVHSSDDALDLLLNPIVVPKRERYFYR